MTTSDFLLDTFKSSRRSGFKLPREVLDHSKDQAMIMYGVTHPGGYGTQLFPSMDEAKGAMKRAGFVAPVIKQHVNGPATLTKLIQGWDGTNTADNDNRTF